MRSLRPALAFASLLVACGSPETASLEVELRTDYRPGSAFDEVRARVSEEGSAAALEEATLPVSATMDFRDGLVVLTVEDQAPRRVAVEVSIWRAGELVASRQILADLGGAARATVVIACTGGSECWSDSADGGPGDAGTDGGECVGGEGGGCVHDAGIVDQGASGGDLGGAACTQPLPLLPASELPRCSPETLACLEAGLEPNGCLDMDATPPSPMGIDCSYCYSYQVLACAGMEGCREPVAAYVCCSQECSDEACVMANCSDEANALNTCLDMLGDACSDALAACFG